MDCASQNKNNKTNNNNFGSRKMSVQVKKNTYESGEIDCASQKKSMGQGKPHRASQKQFGSKKRDRASKKKHPMLQET